MDGKSVLPELSRTVKGAVLKIYAKKLVFSSK